MLSSLTIQDFVIVDRLELSFNQGMSVLSGETGAGKSILIDALSLCLGARADASQIREGCDRANIIAVFECTDAARIVLADQAIDADDELHLRRAIESNGKSKAYVNGVPVPASTLKQLAETLIDIHGQHAFQTLGKPNEQLRLLDDFAQHNALIEQVGIDFKLMRKSEQAFQEAQSSQQEKEARLENLRWKLESLERINPKAGQWETLVADHERLSHGAELLEGTQHALNTLSQNDECLLDQLGHLIERLDKLSHNDTRLDGIVKNLSEGEILLKEAGYDLNHYIKHADLDPDSLEQAEKLLSLWHETARKLRVMPEALPAEMEAVEQELKRLSSDLDLDGLHREVLRTRQNYEESAKKLSASRKKSGKALSAKVTGSMQTLNMQGGVFEINLQDGEPTAKGSDLIEFLVAGHPGVKPQAIQKVASGGELARISLAITVNTVQSTPVPTLIFDEVDSGIGGAVAETVGKYLRQLASNKQVLCVTHLPQVAAQGHTHYQVIKQIQGGKTKSVIQALTEESRVMEVARMLGGQAISETTKQAAREMIAQN
jgi:DNA repair protein RecN (Recombination protein N)